MQLKRISAFILVALALGFTAPPPAQAADKAWIIYGHLCWTDHSFGFISTTDGTAWTFDEEAWKKHCAGVSNAGANAIRILPFAVWDPRPLGRRSQFSPWVLELSNKWNLAKFNARYFAIMRRAIEIANDEGLTVWYAWFDQCQLYAPWSAYSPWKHNTQGVATFLDAAADPYTKAWIKKVVSEFGDLDVLWPWGNEVENPQFVPMAKRVIFPLVKSLKLDFNRMTYGAMMQECPYLGNGEYGDKLDNQGLLKAAIGDEFGDPAKLDIYREAHAVGRPLDSPDPLRPFGSQFAQAMYFWGKNPIRKVLSDDGVHEITNPADGGRPTPAIWKAMATAALAYPVALGGRDKLISFEHLPEGGDLDYQVSVIKAISEAYKAKFGAWPANYGKHPYIPPVEYVMVKVCAANGLIANPYCPETQARKFAKGTEPTKVCAVHVKPAEPDPVEYENIAVCQESGLLPNQYCPGTEVRTFEKGTSPTSTCEIHKKPQDCSCGAWLDTEGGKRRPDIWRWLKCLFGGPKRCR